MRRGSNDEHCGTGLRVCAPAGDSRFHRPLYLESSEATGEVTGEIYALINSPFESAGAALGNAGDWYAAIELYPRQLHEVAQAEYLDMKRKESLRQQAGPV